MQTDLAPHLANTTEGLEAQKLLSNCVHCGFCTATCPTYQLLGDELDGPRGRIYLIKQMAEGKTATEKTRTHLDRCLTCRNCESTCPSGVQYGNLLDIGRKWAEEQAPSRPIGQQAVRWLLKEGLTRPTVFNTAMQLGRIAKPLLPKILQKKIPDTGARHTLAINEPTTYEQSILILEGCVQPGMMPNINQATKRVFAQLGVRVLNASNAGCCGAIRFHLNDHNGAKDDMRRNIDAWWPIVQEGLVIGGPDKIQAIVMNASGCGVTVKDYGHLLKDDPDYSGKAKIISALCKDLSEILPEFTDKLVLKLGSSPKPGVVYHPPCTLQHGQQIRGKVEATLQAIGVGVNLCQDSHLCCGSAGTYSILQSGLSNQLREQKLTHLKDACSTSGAKKIVSANIGCITQLAQNDIPVLHWVEVIDELLRPNH
jgi:glycolate oxidase iron-sulfur subunit